MNENGLTLKRWLFAAQADCQSDAVVTSMWPTWLEAWKRGEDPADWRARHQAASRSRVDAVVRKIRAEGLEAYVARRLELLEAKLVSGPLSETITDNHSPDETQETDQ